MIGSANTVAAWKRHRARLAREVHVWTADPAAHATGCRTAEFYEYLSDTEKRRLGELRYYRDRLAYLVAHGLLREVLSLYSEFAPAQWRFATGRHGKPYINGPGSEMRLCFNLAHTKGAVAIVVTEARACGVDVERIDSHYDAESLSGAVLSTREQRRWHAVPDGRRAADFMESWTLKEAYLKGVGRGIGAGLTSIEVERCGRHGARVVDPDAARHPAQWRLHYLHLDTGHVVAAAVGSVDARELPVVVRRARAARCSGGHPGLGQQLTLEDEEGVAGHRRRGGRSRSDEVSQPASGDQSDHGGAQFRDHHLRDPVVGPGSAADSYRGTAQTCRGRGRS